MFTVQSLRTAVLYSRFNSLRAVYLLMKKLCLVAVVLAVLLVATSLCLYSSKHSAIERSVVVYYQGFALIKEIRVVELSEGLNELVFADIPSQIIPYSIIVKSANTSLKILEHTYDYDLMSYSKLLSRSIGKKILVEMEDKKIEGVLLAFDGSSLILSSENNTIKIVFLNKVRSISIGANTSDFIVKPTLKILVEAEKSGKYCLELIYLTKSLKWTPQYSLLIDEKNGKILEFVGWAVVDNNAGIDLENIDLKLLAGEVNFVSNRQVYLTKALAESGLRDQFTSRKVFEYYVFSLDRKITIRSGESKNIVFITAKNLDCLKEFFVDYVRKGARVYVALSFNNTLGKPLPKGVYRLYKLTEDEVPIFIGEDSVEDTPANGTVRVVVGVAYDIKVERKIVESKKIGEKTIRQKIRIVLRNYGDEKAVISVIEHAYGDWEIVEATHSYIKVDAYSFEFKVEVPPESEVVIEYTIVIYW